MDSKTRRVVQFWLFFAFLLVFVLTSTLTLAALFFGVGEVTQANLDKMVTATLIEVAVGIVALFYAVFGLSRGAVQTDLHSVYGVGVCLAWAQAAKSQAKMKHHLEQAANYTRAAAVFPDGEVVVGRALSAADVESLDEMRSHIRSTITYLHGQLGAPESPNVGDS
jgi:hypothetical protein